MGVWIWLVGVIVLLILWEVDPDLGLRLILFGLAVLGGWIALRSGLRLWLAGRRPVLSLSTDRPLVGQPFTLRYRPPPSGRPIGGLTARLICREAATYRPRGQRQSATDAHDWIVAEVGGDASGGPSGGELALAIPLDAMHSFRSRHHQIGWRVEVDSGRRGGRVDLPLTVLPAVYQP